MSVSRLLLFVGDVYYYVGNPLNNPPPPPPPAILSPETIIWSLVPQFTAAMVCSISSPLCSPGLCFTKSEGNSAYYSGPQTIPCRAGTTSKPLRGWGGGGAFNNKPRNQHGGKPTTLKNGSQEKISRRPSQPA
jgi:hypothetical protein